MLFNPQHRKKIQIFWAVFAGLIILSMVVAYIPSLYQ
jgi:hypothetical protein